MIDIGAWKLQLTYTMVVPLIEGIVRITLVQPHVLVRDIVQQGLKANNINNK